MYILVSLGFTTAIVIQVISKAQNIQSLQINDRSQSSFGRSWAGKYPSCQDLLKWPDTENIQKQIFLGNLHI